MLSFNNIQKQLITEIAFDGEDGQIKYGSWRLDSTGKYELKYKYNTNQIGETKEGAYKVGFLEEKAWPTRVLTPDAAANFCLSSPKRPSN